MTAREALSRPRRRSGTALPQQTPPWLRLQDRGADGRTGRVQAGGAWTLVAAPDLDTQIVALEDLVAREGLERLEVDLSGVERLDTAGAWLLKRFRDTCSGKHCAVTLSGLRPEAEPLLQAVEAARTEAPEPARRGHPVIVRLNAIGAGTVGGLQEALALLNFFGMLVVKTAGIVVRPWRLRIMPVAYHMQATGLNAMPIVGLLAFLIGIVLAYQGAEQLARFGAELFVVNLLGISILRELGVMLTSIIVAGRSGSAFTAQIGAMKVNQEVDAMTTLGLDVAEVLLLPRVLALVLTLPLLVFFANIVALIGGALMAWVTLDITPGQFVQQFRQTVPLTHMLVGIGKAPVFAFVIAMVGCYQGLRVTGSAESVGQMTTRSVVLSIFLVIVLDAVFSIVLFQAGI